MDPKNFEKKFGFGDFFTVTEQLSHRIDVALLLGPQKIQTRLRSSSYTLVEFSGGEWKPYMTFTASVAWSHSNGEYCCAKLDFIVTGQKIIINPRDVKVTLQPQ